MTVYRKSPGEQETATPEDPDTGSALVEALRWMTLYESANAATPRNRLQRVVKRNGEFLGNSGALLATSVLTSLLGFAYWWFAARSFPARVVGSASAAVSAMTLISTLGMFGMGTLLISQLPKAKEGRGSLIASCVMVSATVSTIGGLIYVAAAMFGIPGLRNALGSPIAIGLLLLAMCLNAATLVLDEGLVGMMLGHLQLLRNAYFAVGKLAALAVLIFLPLRATGSEVLATWVAGIVVSLPLIAFSLRNRGLGPIRPGLSELRGLGRNALDHNLLNVALFLPRIALPLVVTSVVSIEANAAFYTAWMVMSFLAMIPGSIATTLFAVASGDAAALRTRVRVGLAVALGLGVPVSTGIAVLAHPIMSLFGNGYAKTAATTLTILALTYSVGVFRQFYVVISRVRNRVRRTSFYAVGIGAMELGAAWYGGNHGGLHGLVIWLAAAFAVEGVLMAPAVLMVALGRVPKSAETPAKADTAGTKQSGDRPARDKPAAKKTDTDTADVTLGAYNAGETVVMRRLSDETTVIPAIRDAVMATVGSRPDETAVIPKIEPDQTTVIPRISAAHTEVIPRVSADQTEVIPRVRSDDVRTADR